MATERHHTNADRETVTLRPGRGNEADQVADLWLRSRKAAVPAIPPPVHSDDEVRGWFKNVVFPEREVWVAEQDGVVVALLVLEDNWIDQLYVDPNQVGRGTGSLLLRRAKDRRPAGLKLWTFVANSGARRFYERHGFVAVGGTDGDNEEGAPDVLYEWPA